MTSNAALNEVPSMRAQSAELASEANVPEQMYIYTMLGLLRRKVDICHI